jgi:hypothetical protein
MTITDDNVSPSVEPDDERSWHICHADKRLGPYPLEALQKAVAKGLLKRSDLAWKPGFEFWKPLSEIEGLFTPPPMSGTPYHSDQTTYSVVLERPRSLDEERATRAISPLHNDVKPASNTDNRNSRSGFILAHWRGEFSLGASYWINGALLNVCFAVLFVILGDGVKNNVGSAPWLLGLSAAIVFCPIVLVWQSVGIWRSASKHQTRTGRLLWARVAKFFVIIGILRAFGDLGAVMPVAGETFTMAFGDKYGPPTFRLLRNGTELEFAGGLSSGVHNEFTKFLAAAPQVKVLHLKSIGGRIAEARVIAREVKNRQLITYVSTFCESACTEIFLAGRQRWAAPTAKIGFHSPSIPGADYESLTSARKDELSYLVSQGVTKQFAERAVTTDSDSMWFPSTQEMLAAGVLTGVSDQSQFAATNVSGLELRKYLDETPMFVAIRNTYPEGYDELIRQITDGYRVGETEQDIIEKGRASILKLVHQSMPFAPPDLAVQHAKLFLNTARETARVDAETCVTMFDPDRGTTARVNIFDRLPQLQDEQANLNAKIIRSAASGSRFPVADQSDFERDAAPIFDKLARSYGDKVKLFNAEKLPPAEFGVYCNMNIDFYQYLLSSLPAERFAKLYRWLQST